MSQLLRAHTSNAEEQNSVLRSILLCPITSGSRGSNASFRSHALIHTQADTDIHT